MKYACFILLLIATLSVNGQNLVYDNSFPPGAAASGSVRKLLSLPDGRIVVGGEFLTFGGIAGRGLVRLWPDGQRDLGFNVGAGVSTRVQELAAGPNGRLYAAGLFNTYAGASVGNLVCLDSTGLIDTNFVAATGFNNEVTALAVYPNGDIIVGGFFSQYKGVAVTQPVKILANGQRDLTFNQGGTGSTGIIDALVVQPDLKILVAGSVNGYNGQTASRLMRLNADGSRDSTFNLNLTISGPINDVSLLPNGQIVIGGTFTTVNGIAMSRIARLLPNGQLDPGFTPGTGFSSTVRTVNRGFEGQVLVGGDFTTFNGQNTSRIAVLDSNGSLQYSTGTCAATNGTVFDILENPNQTLTIGGVFTQIGGATVGRIARILRGGTIVSSTMPVITASTLSSCAGQRITLMIMAGALNGASHWRWYEGSCGGGTSFSSSTTLLVNPLVTTTYFVRGEGNCVVAGPCASVTIVVQDTVAPVPNITNLPTIQGPCGLTIPIPQAGDNCIPNIAGVANRPLTFTEAGQFTVIWTYTDTAGNSSSQTQTIIVDSIDTRVNYNASTNRLYALNTNATYQWVRCDAGYQPIAGATAADFQTTLNGDYAVVIRENGCVDTSSCISLVFTGLEQQSMPGLQLYPNPAGNQLHVVTETAVELRLYDLHGRELFHFEATPGTHPILLPSVKNGLYYWTIQDLVTKRYYYKKQLIQQ